MRRRKILPCLLAAVLACGLLAGCVRLLPPRDSAARPAATETPSVFGETPAAAAEAAPEESGTLYVEILNALAAYSTELTFENQDTEEVVAAFSRVLAEHPELFWVRNGYSWTETTEGFHKSLVFRPITEEDMDAVPGKAAALDAAAEAVLAGIGAEATDYEKALYVHDWLVTNTEYDQAAYDAVLSAEGAALFDSETAYGCLVEHDAICSGYAQAFQLLMQRMGVECLRVTGDKVDGELHAWNCVCLDGDWYYVDVTWDDPVFEEDAAYVVSHEFFCVTEEELRRTHAIPADAGLPACVSTACDYFRVNGLYFEEYDRALLWPIRFGDGLQLKFASEAVTQQALEDLMGNGGVFQVFLTGSDTVSYCVGDSGLVLSIAPA